MAYPFIPFSTVAEFVAIAKKKHGCRLVKLVVNFNGQKKTAYVLQKVADEKCRAPLPKEYSNDKNVRLTPNGIRSLCRRLKIPVKEWLSLG